MIANDFDDLKGIVFLIPFFFFFGCKTEKKEVTHEITESAYELISYAKGFTIEKKENLTLIRISSPWPGAESSFTYALIPKKKMAAMTLNAHEYDAIVAVPVERMVATSTTHIPAIEALGVIDKLIGFPDTKYISSKEARKRIDADEIKELGNNEALNTEMVIELNPEVVVGFSINSQNKAYQTLQRANIPVVYNGDWTEETPLGKAEWIKFFAPFFGLEKKADSIFGTIKSSYEEVKSLAAEAKARPTVLSGALYKDVWYLPGGRSWAAQFLVDANVDYLWKETNETGSLALSIESVLAKAQNADFWISPSQFISHKQMEEVNRHYLRFDPFQNKRIYTFANTRGDTGGLLYYELAPNRPDLVLKDLVHIFHPELLPDHEPFFFKPLE
ncbi:MAG: ABC transporter substrate-binding protein [Aurantibacter sp.]